MSDILIVIDFQNDFIDGSLGTTEAQAIVPNVVRKIAEYEAAGKPIIATLDTHHKDTYLDSIEGKYLPVKHCIVGTDGWRFSPEISEQVAEKFTTIIPKGHFGISNWDEIIEDHDQSVEIIGLCTDICVISNALVLKTFLKQPVTVDASCCAGTTPEMHKKALDVMKSCQIEVINES